ncbi:hypothetical protein ACTNDY_05575 [Tissierellaceae bacterium HCP3S3_D8]
MKNLNKRSFKKILSSILLVVLFLPINLVYANSEEIKPVDLEKWSQLSVFGEVEIQEGNIKHERIATEQNSMSIEQLKNTYSNEELYALIENNLYQAINDQKNGSFIIWNKDVVENHIKYDFPHIYKEIKENNLLKVDYTFFSDNNYKLKNSSKSSGSKDYTFSVTFKDGLRLKIFTVNSFITWEWDSNDKLTSVTADDYINVYDYWEDLGINASTNTYSYDKKTCVHYVEAKTRHNPLVGPKGPICYLWIKIELASTYGKVEDSGIL